jgi:hypothetical protein
MEVAALFMVVVVRDSLLMVSDGSGRWVGGQRPQGSGHVGTSSASC